MKADILTSLLLMYPQITFWAENQENDVLPLRVWGWQTSWSTEMTDSSWIQRLQQHSVWQRSRTCIFRVNRMMINKEEGSVVEWVGTRMRMRWQREQRNRYERIHNWKGQLTKLLKRLLICVWCMDSVAFHHEIELVWRFTVSGQGLRLAHVCVHLTENRLDELLRNNAAEICVPFTLHQSRIFLVTTVPTTV